MRCAHFTCHQCAASGYTFRGGYIEDEAGDRWWSQELLAKVEQERDEARANYQFMVERAADQKLDGYRELGARAAAAENERDALLLRVDTLTHALRCLLLSRDAAWTGGHDWQEAVEQACNALGVGATDEGA